MSVVTFSARRVTSAVSLLMTLVIVSSSGGVCRGESPSTEGKLSLIVVVGASGIPQYEISFYQWAERWESAAKEAGVAVTVIGKHRGEFTIEGTDYDRLRTALKDAESETQRELWIVLIGHGTFDKRVAKFNLRGPDVSANELAQWLQPIRRPTAIINCASASGPFISLLSGPGRVVVTATKAGSEINFTRFGDYLSQAIGNPNADLDKDHQTSLWEAFLTASRKTAEYYDTDGRVATEHALLDDNGDRQGVRADQFRGLTPVSKPADGHPLDGRNANQWHLVPNLTDATIPFEARKKRDELELAIEDLSDRKDALPPDRYWKELERLLIALAEWNEQFER
ncbi:hypothetical protein [Schlesneria paludicola]|uniref:hypothetical protein n=1 Tax=Schlesneria paludicola TaxID=360056 RepID=UPI00029A708E|nr:hypothetical protein [Schlesneria paludicola]